MESVSVLQSVCYVITLLKQKHGSTSHSKKYSNVFYDKFWWETKAKLVGSYARLIKVSVS